MKNNSTFDVSAEIYNLIKKLWPFNRSLTGEGQLQTLKCLQNIQKKIKIKKYKSGKKVFDWTVPDEWILDDAWVKDETGKKIIDFKKNNLHLVGYSNPIKKRIKGITLISHLHFLKKQPNAVPYVTSYYNKNWGFCIKYNDFKKLDKKKFYDVNISSKFKKGVLRIGEVLIKGRSSKEILLTSYICHPSMANNELSGPSLLVYLSKYIEKKIVPNFTYRIIFVPETIGTICYINENLKKLKKNVIAGFNLTCIGDERNYSYLKTREENTLSNKIAKHVLKNLFKKYKIFSWLDRGSDERQYNLPGIDIPVGVLMRTRFGDFPEYHTSLDKLGVTVTKNGLKGSYNYVTKIIDATESIAIKPKLKVKCEPNLGKRGLYPLISQKEVVGRNKFLVNMLNFLGYADGKKNLLEISEIIGIPVWDAKIIYKNLKKHKLVS